jgi:HK97 family phage portal protein
MAIKGGENMGLFSRKLKQKRQTTYDPIAVWMTGTPTNEIILPAGYAPVTRNEEVRKCIHKIADLVSSMTIMLMQNGEKGDIRLKNAMSKKIDVYPNHHMSRKNFIYRIVSDMITHGNAVCLPVVVAGLLDNIIIWDGYSCSFRGNDETYEISYKGQTFDPDELLHFVLVPDEILPYKGNGFIPVVKDAIANIVQANATKTGFLQSKWRPSLIIKVESDAEGMQIKEERDKILNSYVGDTEAGEPWIVPASEIDVTEVKPLSLQDLAIQDGLKLDKQAVAAAFGVPAYMLGVGTFTKDEYNNFLTSTIMPIAKVIEQELSKKIVYATNWYFKFNPKSLYQYDLTELTGHVKEMVNAGMINRNEGRNYFDFSPVEGLDEFVVLENYIPLDQVGNQNKLNNQQQPPDNVPKDQTPPADNAAPAEPPPANP